MQSKLQTLKGFRDFLPQEKRQRDYIQQKLIQVFQKFGFSPLETPTLEYASLLLGKYGDEADKLVYQFTDKGDRQVAMRYDQTVPAARILAQYQNQLPKYFRRYQIQNVFRADKPQKGRYREFSQCDIDIFGTTSPLADAEILACTYAAFKEIGFKNFKLKINDRQTLFGCLQPFVIPEVTIQSIIQTLDKLDKQPESEILAELSSKGLTSANAQAALVAVKSASLSPNLQAIIKKTLSLGVDKDYLEFSPSLARGLDYYTGLIVEVAVADYPVGSCAGGGRYDNLINQLGEVNVPAVGLAFGFDRLIEAAIALNLIPENINQTQVLMTMFDLKTQTTSLETAALLRQAGISVEIYPEFDKLGKQFKTASQASIPWVVVIGETEQASNQLTLKNLATGQQWLLELKDAIARIQTQ